MRAAACGRERTRVQLAAGAVRQDSRPALRSHPVLEVQAMAGITARFVAIQPGWAGVCDQPAGIG